VCHFDKCHYAVCHFAEYYYAECHGAIIMAKSLAFVKTIGDSVIGILLVGILPLLI
jgi:hypothetical protein